MTESSALVTGGSRGIGRATALRLAEAGYRVAICARDEETLTKTLDELPPVPGGHLKFACDLSQPGAGEKLVSHVAQQFGRLDVVVNNAGSGPLGAIDEVDADEFDRCLALNISSVLHVTRCAWPIMKRQGNGVFVNISSLASVDPFPGFHVYGATKAWVNLFTKGAAAEGRPIGIRAFALALGTVDTDLLRGLFPDYPAEQCLSPSAVADYILTLTEPSAMHASGSTIFFYR